METVYNFINGKQVPSRGTKAHPIYNPATGEQIRQVIMSSPEDVNEAIEVAHIGALIIGTTNKGLNMLGVDPYWQQIVKGAIIVVAVLLDTLKRRKKG
ncbi:sugar-transporting ATPase [Aggregatibacter actinomycetemcomitans serotype b str. SCC4092]|nr:sugar-transporting ATPase [Aggregatibacter actinomycetemcomitans serotype b str. SCC1398]KOE54142.1 sugar-transporting ATPase [Aggregatibacter actinomycetemcomitans serotype b str. SCC4092]